MANDRTTNTYLVELPAKLASQVLTEYERQRRYVLQQALIPAQCPMCLRPVNQVEATGKSLDEFDAENGSSTQRELFACPHCKTELRLIVPFMSSGPCTYLWQRRHPVEIPGEETPPASTERDG